MPNLNTQVSGSAIAFIDSQVEDYQSLIAGVTPGTEVVVLDGNRDAIEQITQILALRTNIDSIHIVSHGAPGSLQLGNGCLSADNVETYSEKLQQWRSALNLGADILIYGCNVASSPRAYPKVRQGMNSLAQSSSRLKPTGNNLNKQSSSEDFRYETGVSTPGGIGEQARDLDVDLDIDGFTFIQRIAQLTNTNVAASQNLTGSVAKGGDWELEVRTGKIETPLVFAPEVLAGYEYVLNFGAETNFGAGGQPQFVGVGDFNGDTKPDLAVPNRVANVSILLGTGTGSFSAPTNFPVGQYAFAVTVADFNGDTKLDLAVANSGSNNVSILLGTGTGSFDTATNFNVGSSPWSVTSGDFNGDGNIDLATANIDSNDVSILLGTGTGSFSAPTNFIVGTKPQSVAVGDFNKDGKLDLATANFTSNNVSILLGTGTGSFGTATGFSVGTNPYSVAVQDFNGDANPDIATANEDSNNVSVLLGNGTGGFGATTNFPVGTGPRSVTVGDFNADGKIDLATANSVSSSTPVANNLSVLLGTGTGTFSPATNYSLGSNPWTVTAADLNADGTLDLATSNYWTNNVSVVLNVPTTVNFGSATYSGTEGTTDTAVNIPVTLSGGTPLSDVTVPIAIDPSSSATQNSDYTISPTTVIFPAGTTTLTQNVAVTIKPDNLPENAETAILNLGTITGGVAGTAKQTTLTIAANGTVSYAIAAGTASIPEGNSGTKPLTFTATRSGDTGGASSVNYAIAGTATNVSDYNNIGGTSGATAVTGTINFAADETSKTITLDVLGDTLVEPDETIAVTLSNPTSPGVTPTITSATATTTITNDDTAGFTVNPISGLTTSEAGGKAEFTVKLNAQPTADVTIGLRSDNVEEGTVSTNSLTFTPANYNQPQTITVSGVDDLVTVVDGPQPYKIVTAAAVSTDVNYNNLDPEDVTVTNSDNETPGITVNPTAGLTTGEDGTKANFTVVLNTKPTANVTIGLNSSNVAEGTVSTPSLTFTPANWDTPQPVTVTGVNDSIVDGNIDYKIVTGLAVSDDPDYKLDAADVSLSNQDNDTAGISITPTETTATEGGANGTYSAVLKSQPIAPVTLTLTTGEQIEAIAPITFTADNWQTAQTVTVKAVDDTVVEGTHSGNITHSVSSSDAKYNGIAVAGVVVAIADNDLAPPPPTGTTTPPTGTTTPPTGTTTPPTGTTTPPTDTTTPTPTSVSAGITVSPTNGLITTKTGAKAKFTVTLNSPPTAPVTIGLNVSPQNPTEGSLSTPAVTFTPENWNIPQEVTVKGEGGTLSAAANRPYTIVTAPAISTDSKYSGLDASDVSLTNMFVYSGNQYSPQIVVGSTNGLITTEAGGTANFSVVLTRQPIADVVIPVSSDNPAEGTVSVSMLKFTPDNWDTAQIVTIKGVNDNQSDGDRPYKIILDRVITNEPAGTTSSSSPGYSGFDPQDVSVTNLERSYTFNKINTEISNDFNGGAISGWGDYSGDGKLDFIASGGLKPLTRFGSADNFTGTWLYQNTGSTFSAESGVPSWELASAASWGDYDNDGKLNWALQTVGNGRIQTPSFLKIYGNYAFKSQQRSSADSSQVWGDYNNDGKLDLLNATQQSIFDSDTGLSQQNVSVLYRNSGSIFTPDFSAELPGVTDGSAAWGDYNKDGKLDILLTGDSLSGKITKVFGNTGSGFSDEAFALPGVSDGSAAWGDYDNDGDLDILLAGDTGSGKIAKVYRNTGSGFNEDTTAVLPGGSFAAWGDYDNDGKLDILLDSKVYRNTGSGFSEDISAGLIGDGSGAWGDYDSDGKLDILLYNQVYRSNTAIANTPPAAPTGLSALPSGREVTFKWNKATDAQTPADGLSYNLRVGTTPGGSDILAPMSLNDGTRQVVGLGNANQNTEWQLKDLSPDKTYYWSVQAIDTAWAGSPFASEGSFTTVANRPPVLTNPILSQGRNKFRSDLNLTLAPDTFTDPDPGDKLTYFYSIIPEPEPNVGPLIPNPLDWLTFNSNTGTFIPPNWLKFDPNTLTFSVDLNAGNVPSLFYLPIKVTATDNAGATATDFFHLYRNGISGIAIDGYISGATLFLDANKNGILDANEPSTITNSNGEFNLNIPFETFDTNKNGEIDPSEGNLVATGGTDTATGLPLETPLTAPPDSSVVTLLTTLVADLTDKGIALEEAQSLVKAALSLPAEVDLTSFDPIEATNNNQPGGVQVLAAMVKVQNFITQTSGLIDGASSAVNTDIVKAVVSSITNQIQSGTVLNLSNAAALEPIIQQAATKIQQIDPSFNTQQVSQITSQAATVMATANQRIDSAVSNPTATSIPESLARLQQVALGPTTQDFKEVGTGNKPISQVVADNTGTALDSRIEAVILPAGIATPVVSGDADLGSNSPNAIIGTNGDDILTGNSGNDVLMGMRGNDSLDGSLGNDSVFGGKGSDTILGSSGDDALFGNRGADILNGDDGNDMLYGGKGDDLLNGGLGIDTLIGGMGVDKFLLSTNSGTDTITDFEIGKDLLVLGNGLTFSQLTIAQDSGATLIRFAQTGEILASLGGVSASSIGAANFGLL
ncbi:MULTISPECIES: FG-GAP-like repeat-containing protein [unclassified Microcoleus]|uniref:FG-GAP-like repeat-containing protein n=1 Tax=unclassified Microcoleus TaxID=2642155 RepID=UPI002FD24DB7